jgi:23S rRNA G2069 N7-methylase RlmK/C1962 C5-methylase RlmI
MDVSRFLDEATTNHSYDIIILDPPVFSNSKKFSGVLDLKRDAAGLVKKTLQLLSPGGKLYFSARSNTFNAEAEERVIAAYPGAEIRDISAQIRDKDFEKRKIPAWREIQTK